MPVTKTAKRALRGSKRKGEVNKKIISALEISVRIAKKTKKASDVQKAVSQTDKAKKKNVIHKNKASRIKSSLSKLLLKNQTVKTSAKKTSKSSRIQKATSPKK
jgi:small subunit ribosomal protein S20